MANSQNLCRLVLSPWHGQDKHNASCNTALAAGEASQTYLNTSAPNGVRYNMGRRTQKVAAVSRVEDRARAWARQAASPK